MDPFLGGFWWFWPVLGGPRDPPIHGFDEFDAVLEGILDVHETPLCGVPLRRGLFWDPILGWFWSESWSFIG